MRLGGITGSSRTNLMKCSSPDFRYFFKFSIGSVSRGMRRLPWRASLTCEERPSRRARRPGRRLRRAALTVGARPPDHLGSMVAAGKQHARGLLTAAVGALVVA